MTFEKALEEMKEKALKLIPKECGILIAVKKNVVFHIERR